MAKIQHQTIIIIDPDSDFSEWACKHLAADTVDVIATADPADGVKQFLDQKADLLISELKLGEVDGVTVLKQVRMKMPNALVILNGVISSTNSMIEAMRIGAFDILRKEVVPFELKAIVERALQSAEEMRQAEAAAASNKVIETSEAQPSGDLIIGRSPAMQDVYKLIGRVAPTDAPVLITGESGVGKEVVSNAIHQFSRRSKGEYVAINCAAIPSNLLESELFGHEKGAFTGATTQRVGRFEQCHNGTLFLDEIGEMPLEVQSKLLRVLQSGEFSRVGGNQTLQSDVRILAATNKRLEDEVEAGTFREDLFYRLNVVRIHIPPLRQRSEDIRPLADFFLQKKSGSQKSRAIQLSSEAADMLGNHLWPGNVRELENLIERACVLATGNVLLPQDLPFDEVTSVSSKRNRLETAARIFIAQAQETGEDPVALAKQHIESIAS
ncbi:MAG: sigma-54 dependent transcriptional regulator [Verrucomicrobiota bacterium]